MAYLVVRIKGTVNIPQQARKTLNGLNLEKRGRKSGYKPITKPDLPEEYNSMEDLAFAIAENRVAMSKLEGIKPWFALSPPKGGFKRKTKTQYMQDGVLGEDGELSEIVKRML